MFLTEVNIRDVILKQYRYKMNAYLGVFTSLMFVQLLGLFFSFSGTGSWGGSSESFSYDVKTYSGTLVAAFTLIWAFSNGISLTTKQQRYDDFNFVTNRKTSNYANGLFLLTTAAIGAITGFLSNYVLWFLVSQLLKTASYAVDQLSTLELVQGIIGFFFYILMFASLGYFIGMLVQTNKMVAFLLPVLFIVLTSMQVYFIGGALIAELAIFFVRETSFLIFILKSVITTVILFAAAFLLANRLEVGK